MAAQDQFDDYDQIAEAKKLLDTGAISDEEFGELKAKALAR